MSDFIDPTMQSVVDDVSSRLHAARTEFSKSEKEIEEAICGLRVGVRASVEIPVTADDKTVRRLVFGKFKKQWRFSVVEEGEEEKSLGQASIGVRMRAMGEIQNLIVAMVQEAERQIIETENAAKSAHELAALIRLATKREPIVEVKK